MNEKAENCETLMLSGPLEGIKASYTSAGVNAIAYERNGVS